MVDWRPCHAWESPMFSLLVRFTVLPGHLEATNERSTWPTGITTSSCTTESTPDPGHFLAERGQHLSGDPEVWWLTTIGESGSGEGGSR